MMKQVTFALLVLLVPTGVSGITQPQRSEGAVSPDQVISVLSLRPLASTLNSALEAIKDKLGSRSASGTDSQHKIKVLYDQLLDLQNARELYVRNLTPYIKERQRNPPNPEQLRIAGYELLTSDERAQRYFVAVLNTLKDLQVQLDINYPTGYRGLRFYLYSNEHNLFVPSFFQLNVAQLRAIAKDATENSKILEEAIDGLRDFIRQKYPSLAS